MKKTVLFGLLAMLAQAAQPQLTVQPGASLYCTGNVQVTLLNTDLVDKGTMVLANTSRLAFTGNGNNTIDVSPSTLFGELEIAKINGIQLTLKSDISINGKIVFKSGLIELNSQRIDLGPAAFLENENENSRITGIHGGLVEFTTDLNTPSMSNPAGLGIVISSTKDLGKVTIQRGHQSQKNSEGGGNSINRFYNIFSENNNGLNATVRLQYFNSELNGLDANTLTVYKGTNNLHWKNIGFDTRDAITKYVQQIKLDDLSRLTLSAPNNALPLHWGAITGRCTDDGIDVQWQTLMEENTESFTVQRSADGIEWTSIATMPAAINSSTALNYHYFDKYPNKFYRILQKDANGAYTYSPILSNTCVVREWVSIHPNPTAADLKLSFYTSNRGPVLLQVIDAKGSLIKEQQVQVVPGNNQFTINLYGLPAGIYHLAINGAGRQQVMRFEKY